MVRALPSSDKGTTAEERSLGCDPWTGSGEEMDSKDWEVALTAPASRSKGATTEERSSAVDHGLGMVGTRGTWVGALAVWVPPITSPSTALSSEKALPSSKSESKLEDVMAEPGHNKRKRDDEKLHGGSRNRRGGGVGWMTTRL